ncbi:hypothetical protein CSR02_13800 [Acetobacter pomorum]|uniref:Uncharacterized protein n=1 Tax=Acetobacter pomorum TaxID=65959 RepID=A0A2G4R8V9_9PROT|nr:hypothetical protein CSR02_13800 [Acetobacter pomorum]
MSWSQASFCLQGVISLLYSGNPERTQACMSHTLCNANVWLLPRTSLQTLRAPPDALPHANKIPCGNHGIPAFTFSCQNTKGSGLPQNQPMMLWRAR